MKKKGKDIFIFNAAVGEIFLLVSMIFAISVLMSEEVSADGHATLPVGIQIKPGTQIKILPSKIPTAANAFGSQKMYAIPVKPTANTLDSVSYYDKGLYEVKGTSDFATAGNLYTPEEIETIYGYKLTTANPYASQGYEGVSIGRSKPFLVNSPVWGSLVQGVMFAAVVVGVVQLVGNLAGLDKPLIDSLSYSLGGGIVGGMLVKGAIIKSIGTGSGGMANFFKFGSSKLPAGQAGFIWGMALSIALFVLTYKKEKKEIVKFTCLPYEPPSGGAKCEECNKDIFKPCSEYRCKSLGQACELLNPGTKEEKCAWVSRNDVKSPIITPEPKAFAPSELNLKFEPDKSIRPPAIGVKIISPNGREGCVPAFTPLEFGFATDEPAQCVVSWNHTNSFDETFANGFYVGDNSYFIYNHTQRMKLPNENLMAPLLQNDGTFGLFARCKDANGNYNVDEYSFKFCVEKGPDTTPPVVEGFSIPSGSYITFNKDNLDIEMYVNEPAECKWSTQSKEYNLMENIMTCGVKTYEINAELMYACSTKLTGIKDREDNKFYFRCLDQPEAIESSSRNVNLQSKEYIVKGSKPLDIISVKPNETISGSTEFVSVELEVETSNGAEENGNAVCMVSPDGAIGSYIEMFETKSYKHKQAYNLVGNDYSFFFRCIDAGGNSAENSTSFRVIVDKDSPKITRVYKDEALKLVTDENAECVYSSTTCNFQFKDGKKMEYSKADVQNNHFAEWKENGVYYIKCKDDYQNQPDESKCSLIVRAVDLVSKSS
ncbi:MAG: hypothetical protein AABX07_00530 [Nanoarchaeota archaeon]